METFLTTFTGVMEHSEWTPGVALLHLRTCLRGEARDSASGETLWQAVENLRCRFGLTATQARSKLASLCYDGKQNLHALAADIERFYRVGHPSMPALNRSMLAIDTFKRVLHNTELEQHLLTVSDTNLREVVIAAEKWLGVGSTNRFRQLPRPRVAALADVGVEQTPGPHKETELVGLIKQLTETVVSNSQAIAKLSSRADVSANKGAGQSLNNGMASSLRTSGPCYHCKGPHMKRDCPELKQSGNGNRSQ